MFRWGHLDITRTLIAGRPPADVQRELTPGKISVGTKIRYTNHGVGDFLGEVVGTDYLKLGARDGSTSGIFFYLVHNLKNSNTEWLTYNQVTAIEPQEVGHENG